MTDEDDKAERPDATAAEQADPADVIVVTAVGDAGDGSGPSGINPVRRRRPGFLDVEIPALGLAGMAATVFVVAAVLVFGVLAFLV